MGAIMPWRFSWIRPGRRIDHRWLRGQDATCPEPGSSGCRHDRDQRDPQDSHAAPPARFAMMRNLHGHPGRTIAICVDEPTSSPGDDGRQGVHDDHVAGLELGRQELLDVGKKHRPDHRAIQQRRSDRANAAQAYPKRGGVPAAVRIMFVAAPGPPTCRQGRSRTWPSIPPGRASARLRRQTSEMASSPRAMVSSRKRK